MVEHSKEHDLYDHRLSSLLSVIGSGLYIAATRFSWFAGPVERRRPAKFGADSFIRGRRAGDKASTRETIVVTRAIYVAAGDTIQTQADGRCDAAR